MAVYATTGGSGTAVETLLVGTDGAAVSPSSPLPTSLKVLTPSTTVTRPADTAVYAAGDLVANSTTAGSVVPLSFATAALSSGGTFLVRKVRLSKTSVTTSGASFRLWLFTTTPTIATTGDNGVFATVVSGAAGFIGTATVSAMSALADGAVGNAAADTGNDMMVDLSSGTTIYGLIEARGAYTPTSGEVFTVTLELAQN